MAEFTTEQVVGEGRRPLEIDVFRPAGAPNGVAVVLLHGGGFALGNRAMMHIQAESLAKLGFVAIAGEYRLVGEAAWPAQLNDVRDVVRWTKANAAKLGVDPSKIALQGFSAGGHLALMVGGTQPGSDNAGHLGNTDGTEVGAVVTFFPPTQGDVNGAHTRPPFAGLVGDGGLEAAKAASPYNYVNPKSPPTFIVGGMADYMVPVVAGQTLLQRFVEVGAPVEFHYFHGQKHEFSSTPGMVDGVNAEIGFFLRRILLEKDALEEEQKRLNFFARANNVAEFQQMMAQAQGGH